MRYASLFQPITNVANIPTPMSTDMIGEVVHGVGQAARRVREGGLDGTDVHASSRCLLQQLMSPATSHRDDQYGGSFENRLRFLMEAIAEIRRVVGDDFCVGIRLPNEEYIPGGLTPDDITTHLVGDVAKDTTIAPEVPISEIVKGRRRRNGPQCPYRRSMGRRADERP